VRNEKEFITMHSGKIRPIVLCAVQNENSLLVYEGYDPKRELTFYRFLGGGIEFGEHSREAAVREFKEELGVELIGLEFVGALESIFRYKDEPGHELVFLYRATFADAEYYRKPRLEMNENGELMYAQWKSLEDFRSGKAKLVPDGVLELLELA
jgi:8-oxo-dGTP pyrophosphatase MutT (NUDIX family)